jgi:anti-sigma regulatory factor (Ser/Thr protein kinase)
MGGRMPPDSIELTLPAGREWHAVARLVLGGIADRLNLSFEDLDDLQLAVERLLVEAASQETVRIRVDVADHGVRVGVGPLAERTLADALQARDEAPGELTLRRILQTVVDSFGVEELADGGIVVRLQKAVRGR